MPTEPSSGLSGKIATLFRWVAIIYGISTGLATLFYWSQLPVISEFNRLSGDSQNGILLVITIGCAIALAVIATILVNNKKEDRAAHVRRLSFLLLPLAITPVAVVLSNPTVFVTQPLNKLLLILLLCIYLEYSLRLGLEKNSGVVTYVTNHTRSLFNRLPPRTALLVLAAIVCMFIVYFGHHGILNHYRFQTYSFDLGLYDNMTWNSLRGAWFHASPLGHGDEFHFPYHAEFGVYFLAPFYALRQQADTLIALQTILVGLSMVPLYLLSRHHLKQDWLAILICVIFTLYPAVHGPLFYDFHYLTISPFFVFWVMYFYEKERLPWLVITTIAALLLREDIGAGLCALGLYYLLTGRKPAWALWLVCGSLSYFIVMKGFVMSSFPNAERLEQTHLWAYSELMPGDSSSLASILSTIVTNPVYAFKHVFDSDKLVYILQLFIPLAFLPVRARQTWLLFTAAATFTLLSTGYNPLYQINFQYVAYWIPYVFLALVIGLQQKLASSPHVIIANVITLLVASLLMSIHFGSIFHSKTIQGDMVPITHRLSQEDLTAYRMFMAITRSVPQDASIAATDNEVPHLSNRRTCYTLKYGHGEVDYILARKSTLKNNKASLSALNTALAGNTYTLISENAIFALWRKNRD